MAQESYIDGVIRRICNREGGYTNDPDDPGGPTKYGITQATLSAWRKRPVSASEVKALTLDEACQIYKALYVEKPGFLKFKDDAFAEQLIDTGVNHGTKTSILMVQKIVGAVQDGIIGKETVSKYKATTAWTVLAKLIAARLNAYAGIMTKKPTQIKWAGGWLNRCAEMTEIYVKAVQIDPAIEGKLLQTAKFARQESLRIQGSMAVRKQSASIFKAVASKYSSLTG